MTDQPTAGNVLTALGVRARIGDVARHSGTVGAIKAAEEIAASHEILRQRVAQGEHVNENLRQMMEQADAREQALREQLSAIRILVSRAEDGGYELMRVEPISDILDPDAAARPPVREENER